MNQIDFKDKYIKYKTKYLNLLNQIGGDYISDMELMTPTDFITNIINIILGKKTLNNDFLKLDDFSDQSSNDQLLNDVILYHYFMDTPLFNNKLSGTNYFQNLNFIFDICKHMYADILKIVAKHNHLIILSQGDSPSYFMFIIKMLFPEILSNKKITIIEFPISKLGKACCDNIDITKYLDFIIKKYVPKSVLCLDHNYLVFDYTQSGDSINYIISSIKKLYTDKMYNQSISSNYDFATAFDIAKYFINKDQQECYNKKKCKLIKKGIDNWNANRCKYIIKNLGESISSYSDDLINFPNQTYILEYFVDDDYPKRCQYSMSAIDANEYICHTQTKNELINFKDFISSKLSTEQIYQLYSSCNNLLYFIYMYYTFPDKVICSVIKLHKYLNKKILEDSLISAKINTFMVFDINTNQMRINGIFEFKIKKGLIQIYNNKVEKIYLEITHSSGKSKIVQFKNIINFELIK